MMFISKKALPRRTFLRGVGASFALPWLDAMVPANRLWASTEAGMAADKTRLVCIEQVHGAAGSTRTGQKLHYWSPEREGSDFEFTSTLKSLEPYREYITIVTNTDLENARARTSNEEGADHTRSSAVYLTAAHPKKTEGHDIRAGVSMDQIAAENIGHHTRFPSLELLKSGTGLKAHSVSWSREGVALAAENNPADGDQQQEPDQVGDHAGRHKQDTGNQYQ